MNECIISDESSNVEAVRSAIQSGERDLVAAGGDGTVNALLSAIMCSTTEMTRGSLRFGAIGLGSSNDFHKPPDSSTSLHGLPLAIDCERARPRDVGKLTYSDGGGEHTRYFLINASVGVTATANHLFSHPDTVLRQLKHLSTSLSIYYAALKMVAMARNVHVTLKTGTERLYNINLTNLAVLKSPYVSGNLKYPCNVDPGNGLFDVVVHHSMSRTKLLALLVKMARSGRNGPESDSITFQSAGISISSEETLIVEFDGETIQSRATEFTVIPGALRVCK